MKKIILYISLLSMVACSSVNQNERKISSVGNDLTGTYLAVSDYGRVKGLNKAATRIYFHPIKGETGKYNVVLLEYVNLLKMAPSYIASNKLPFIAKKTGFLKNITSKIFAYEATPGAKEGTYELRPLAVVEDRIEVKQGATPRILTLAADAKAASPLEGATISSSRADDPKEIFFPKAGDNEKRTGFQYGMAKVAYEKVKLESTWREEFLKGPYLSQYYNREDIVLKLRKDNSAEFVINPKYAKMPAAKRKAMFTSEKSAFLQGEFAVTEPREGMFLFNTVNADDKTKKIVNGRIALFIDIFDATKSLNQDVVELTLIDSEDPTDFLMYYEDPDNGEGTDTALHNN